MIEHDNIMIDHENIQKSVIDRFERSLNGKYYNGKYYNVLRALFQRKSRALGTDNILQ